LIKYRIQGESVRILWQGFVDPVAHHAYADRLVGYLDQLAGPETEFEMRGLRPPDRHLHRMTEFRCAAHAIASVVQAEDDGFDAVIIGHFQDSGLGEARAAVDIPVVGLGESSMLHACTLGHRIGLITISPTFIPWHEEQVLRYRLEHRVVAVRAMETSVDLYMRAFGGGEAYQEVRRQFEGHAAELARAGVEVVIPAGGLPALLFREEQGFTVEGAVVLNPTPVAAKTAEMAVELRRLNGTGPSRASTFALASPEARAEYLEQMGGHAVGRA
jgi:allantoin racemase